METDGLQPGTIILLAIIFGFIVAISIKGQREIIKAFRKFCSENGLKYSKSPFQLGVTSVENAWFNSILGGLYRLYKDLCEGEYKNKEVMILKCHYGEKPACYLSVFIFKLPCNLPRTFLWTNECRDDLKEYKKWQVKEIDNRIICSENLSKLSEEFKDCLEQLSAEQSLDKTRIEFIDSYIIFVPHFSFKQPDEDFKNYLDQLTDSVSKLEKLLKN